MTYNPPDKFLKASLVLHRRPWRYSHPSSMYLCETRKESNKKVFE